MPSTFAVTRRRGPAWDASKPLRQQEKWDEHAAFMNQLAADGWIVLGGPVGNEGDVLLAMQAASEEEIRSILDRDPWTPLGLLELVEIRRWTILLAGLTHPADLLRQ